MSDEVPDNWGKVIKTTPDWHNATCESCVFSGGGSHHCHKDPVRMLIAKDETVRDGRTNTSVKKTGRLIFSRACSKYQFHRIEKADPE